MNLEGCYKTRVYYMEGSLKELAYDIWLQFDIGLFSARLNLVIGAQTKDTDEQ